MALDDDLLYQLTGANIRAARERSVPRMSQAALAKIVKLTRASVVNIEAGRQRAPLHVLWQIAIALGTEVSALVPRISDLNSSREPIKLDPGTVALIEASANHDPQAKKDLERFVARIQARPAVSKDELKN